MPGEPRKRTTVPGLKVVTDCQSSTSLASGETTSIFGGDVTTAVTTDGITLKKYSYINELFHSDHRPVYAEFHVELLQSD